MLLGAHSEWLNNRCRFDGNYNDYFVVGGGGGYSLLMLGSTVHRMNPEPLKSDLELNLPAETMTTQESLAGGEMDLPKKREL